MIKGRKELRIHITSSFLVAIVGSMTFTTFLSGTLFPGVEFGTSNSFIRLASATSSDGDGGGAEGNGEEGSSNGDLEGGSTTEVGEDEEGTEGPDDEVNEDDNANTEGVASEQQIPSGTLTPEEQITQPADTIPLPEGEAVPPESTCPAVPSGGPTYVDENGCTVSFCPLLSGVVPSDSPLLEGCSSNSSIPPPEGAALPPSGEAALPPSGEEALPPPEGAAPEVQQTCPEGQIASESETGEIECVDAVNQTCPEGQLASESETGEIECVDAVNETGDDTVEYGGGEGREAPFIPPK